MIPMQGPLFCFASSFSASCLLHLPLAVPEPKEKKNKTERRHTLVQNSERKNTLSTKNTLANA
jgi:hypothetical protein